MSPRLKSKNIITIGLIPAAGRGSRMFEYTKLVPKPMIPVLGQPIIEYVVNQMIKEGIKKIYITIGYKGKTIKDYFGNGSKKGIEIRYLKLKNQKSGLAASIGLAEKYIRKPFLTILGDDLTMTDSLKNLFDTFYKNKAYVVEGVIKEKNRKILRETCSLILDKNKKIIKILEKPSSPPSNIRGCGVYVFDPIVFEYIKKTQKTARGIEITNTIGLVARDKKSFGEFIRGINININQPEDLLKAAKILGKKEAR